MDVQINGNKIYAPLKDKWLVLKPEEEVRQKYICRLIDNYGYSVEQMDQEIQVSNSQRGLGAARADIVVWKSKEDKLAVPTKSPITVVECKAESVTIHEADYFQFLQSSVCNFLLKQRLWLHLQEFLCLEAALTDNEGFCILELFTKLSQTRIAVVRVAFHLNGKKLAVFL